MAALRTCEMRLAEARRALADAEHELRRATDNEYFAIGHDNRMAALRRLSRAQAAVQTQNSELVNAQGALRHAQAEEAAAIALLTPHSRPINQRPGYQPRQQSRQPSRPPSRGGPSTWAEPVIAGGPSNPRDPQLMDRGVRFARPSTLREPPDEDPRHPTKVDHYGTAITRTNTQKTHKGLKDKDKDKTVVAGGPSNPRDPQLMDRGVRFARPSTLQEPPDEDPRHPTKVDRYGTPIARSNTKRGDKDRDKGKKDDKDKKGKRR